MLTVTPDQLALTMIGFVLIGFLFVGAMAHKSAPKRPQPTRLHPHRIVRRTVNRKAQAAAVKATGFLDATPRFGPLNCPACGGDSSVFRYGEISIVTLDRGLLATGTCLTPRKHPWGFGPCAQIAVSEVFSASVGAELVNRGAKTMHPRMAAFRAELAAVSNVAQLTDAIVEAQRPTP